MITVAWQLLTYYQLPQWLELDKNVLNSVNVFSDKVSPVSPHNVDLSNRFWSTIILSNFHDAFPWLHVLNTCFIILASAAVIWYWENSTVKRLRATSVVIWLWPDNVNVRFVFMKTIHYTVMITGQLFVNHGSVIFAKARKLPPRINIIR